MQKAKLALVKIVDRRPQNLKKKERDEQAYLELLFGKYRTALRHYLAKLLRNDDDAADLLQETYLKLIEQASLDHLETNARAYLFRVATNLVRDKARKDKVRAQGKHQSTEVTVLVSEWASPCQQAEWDQALLKVNSAIQNLKPRCQEVFILHRYRSMSYPQIAKIMGTTTRTIEREMSTAIAQLKASLGDSNE
ncbi:MAG: RNA polymerase sigma factor [Pseudomonadales bacterium]|nr:RNA polymerase sigma factor [Pseudomonadales bacterium]